MPGSRPGDVFDVQRLGDERYVFVRLHRPDLLPGMSRDECLEAISRSPLTVTASWPELRRLTGEP